MVRKKPGKLVTPPPSRPTSTAMGCGGAGECDAAKVRSTDDGSSQVNAKVRVECDRALNSLQRGNHNKALRMIQEVSQRFESCALVYRVQGFICVKTASVINNPNVKQRYLKKAFESARMAMELSPNSIAFAHFYAKLLYDESEEYDQVVQQCQRALGVEYPVDPAMEDFLEESEQKFMTAEGRISFIQGELRLLIKKANIASISTWMKNLNNGKEKFRLIPLRMAAEDRMELNMVESQRPDETKRATKIPEERRKGIEAKVAAAMLLQIQQQSGMSQLQTGGEKLSKMPENGEEKLRLTPLRMAAEDRMEPKVVQTQRPDETKGATKTPEERRKENESREAAAMLLQLQKQSGMPQLQTGEEKLSKMPENGEEKFRLIPLRMAAVDRMELKMVQTQRPDETKRATKTPEERRKENEAREAAAMLLQSDNDTRGTEEKIKDNKKGMDNRRANDTEIYSARGQCIQELEEVIERIQQTKDIFEDLLENALSFMVSAEPCGAGESSISPKVKAEDGSQVDILGTGLKNENGEYNCFLNVIVQSLWHIQRFVDEFLSTSVLQHVHIGDPCVVCALYDIFTSLNIASMHRSREAETPKSLKIALSELYPKSTFFQKRQMNDASEVLGIIFDCLHRSFTARPIVSDTKLKEKNCTGSWDCLNKDCIAHSMFGMNTFERMICQSCQLESRQMKYTSFFHYINASALRAMKVMHTDNSFDKLLNLVDMNHQVACDPESGGCGKHNYIHHILSARPHVFTTVLGWQNTCETSEDIKATLAALSTEIDVSVIYQGLDHTNKHFLISVVCYCRQHFICFAYIRDHELWLMYDDETVKATGSWEEVLSTCERERLQPQLLFFESVI